MKMSDIIVTFKRPWSPGKSENVMKVVGLSKALSINERIIKLADWSV